MQSITRAEAVVASHLVEPREGECLGFSQRCTLILAVDPLDDDEFRDLTVTSFIGQQREVMAEIRLYAQGLQEIIKADATPQVRAGVERATAAAAGLAAIVNPAAGPVLSAFREPVTRGIVWLFGQYQEQVKLDALRHATAQMNPLIQEAVGMFGGTADSGADVARNLLATDFSTKLEAFHDGPSPTTLAAAADAAQRLDVVLSDNPRGVFDALGTAHGELTAALVSDQITLAEAIRQIERFAKEADEFRALVQELKKTADALPQD